MPMWAYDQSPLMLAIIMVTGIEAVSLVLLILARRFVLPRLRFNDGVNDAVSGTVQAIGVFYGITVGLIAVGVWNTHSSAQDIVSKEAAAIGTLYRNVSEYPQPVREKLQSALRAYTSTIVNDVWAEQRKGRISDAATPIINDFQNALYGFEPTTQSQTSLHNETLKAFNDLITFRRLRADAVGGALSAVMWAVIWVGAAISIGVAYLYNIQDGRLHSVLVALMAGFLAMVIFMIVINDRPFTGRNGISPDSYQILIDRVFAPK